MIKQISIILLSLIAISSYGQDSLKISTYTFSLSEAKKFALDNNTKIKNAKLEIAIAKKKVWETTAIGLPQVNASVSYQNIFEAPTMTMYNMTYIPMGAPPAHTHGMDSSVMELGVVENITADISVSQLIFSGEYLVGLKASKTYQDLSTQSLVKTESEVIEDVENAYHTVLVIEENKKVLEKNLENIKTLIQEMEKLLNVGYIEDTDLDQLKISESQIEAGIYNLENLANLSYSFLAIQLGVKLENTITLTDNLDVIINEISMELDLNKFNLESSINYQLLETQEKLMDLSLKREKSTVLPTLSAFYQHQELKDKPAMNFNPPNVVGISLKMPIFASGSRYVKIQQAQMELEKIQNTKEEASKGLSVEYAQALMQVNDSKNNLKTLSKNLELSKRIYDKTLIKFKNGISSSTDLTQVQNQYLQIQTNYYNTALNLLKAKSKLERIKK